MRILAGTTLGLTGDGDEPHAVSARSETTTKAMGMRFTKDLLGKSSIVTPQLSNPIPNAPVADASLHTITRTVQAALHAANTCDVRRRDVGRRHLHRGRCFLLREPLLEVGTAMPLLRRHGDR